MATKITVTREHGNTGDVVVALDRGDTGAKFHVPGDVTAFTALRLVAPWLEGQFAGEGPAEGEPAGPPDETGKTSGDPPAAGDGEEGGAK